MNSVLFHMKLHQILEGSYVVKNKDGKERRFKDAGAADAVAWASSSSPKKSTQKYSAAWWDEKSRKDHMDGTIGIYPWSKIQDQQLSEQTDSVFDTAGFVGVDDWNIIRHYTEEVGGVGVAAVVVRVTYSIDREDDMGVDDHASDSGYIRVRRDTMKPKMLIFAGFVQ